MKKNNILIFYVLAFLQGLVFIAVFVRYIVQIVELH